jgi:hypothetical protein
MMTATVEKVGRVTLGRHDYGWGVECDLVSIDGEPFAEVHLKSGTAYFSPCGYCDDFSGSKPHFGHVLAGVCFQCNGRGSSKRFDSLADVERIVKRRKADRARRERKAAEAAAAAEAERDAWAAANPDLAARLAEVAAECTPPPGDSTEADWKAYTDACAKWGLFIEEVAAKSTARALTEKQTAAVAKAVAEVEEREAARAEVLATKRYHGAVKDKVVAATGTVVVRATYETHYSYTPTWNCLLVIEGSGDFEGVTFKTSGTGATLWDAARGDEVEVSGTIKDHADYEGTPQTVLTRAKIKVTKPADREDDE